MFSKKTTFTQSLLLNKCDEIIGRRTRHVKVLLLGEFLGHHYSPSPARVHNIFQNVLISLRYFCCMYFMLVCGFELTDRKQFLDHINWIFCFFYRIILILFAFLSCNCQMFFSIQNQLPIEHVK